MKNLIALFIFFATIFFLNVISFSDDSRKSEADKKALEDGKKEPAKPEHEWFMICDFDTAADKRTVLFYRFQSWEHHQKILETAGKCWGNVGWNWLNYKNSPKTTTDLHNSEGQLWNSKLPNGQNCLIYKSKKLVHEVKEPGDELEAGLFEYCMLVDPKNREVLFKKTDNIVALKAAMQVMGKKWGGLKYNFNSPISAIRSRQDRFSATLMQWRKGDTSWELSDGKFCKK